MSKKFSLSFRQNPLGIQILDGKLNQTLQAKIWENWNSDFWKLQKVWHAHTARYQTNMPLY